jgi:hypothetical protein
VKLLHRANKKAGSVPASILSVFIGGLLPYYVLIIRQALVFHVKNAISLRYGLKSVYYLPNKLYDTG